MSAIKLIPATKDYIWGGSKLKEKYGKRSDTQKIAETWELSFHKDGLTKSMDGANLIDCVSKAELGENTAEFEFFPVLVKLIDAADNLSVQVHPSDEYALKNENSYGKTEMWYIVEAEEGAGIYLGFKNSVTKEQYASAIKDGIILDLLNFYKVKKGESYFITSGTVHAIGKGVTICEIQQNSNLTYRVFDYLRKDKEGNYRPLHIEKAKEVSNLDKFENTTLSVTDGCKRVLGVSKYFTASEIKLSGATLLEVGKKSFLSLTCTDGEGVLTEDISGENETQLTFKKGDTLFVPANEGKINLKGECTLIAVEIVKYYIGIDLGGTFIKGGIISENGLIITEDKMPTETEKGADAVIDNIIKLIKKLLGNSNLTSSDVSGVGMGVPGMIDSKNGSVIFSNNLKWENVKIAEKVSKELGLSVKIANDANVAALGEAKFGAGAAFDDCVLLTLGTGVGSGIIIGGKLFEGNMSVGAEMGHMVVVDGGEECTCGRRGCLEAYASATALIRDTRRAMAAHKDSKMWECGGLENVTGKTAFDFKDTDEYAKAVIDGYLEKLACGIINVANIFRPEAVMLGGGVCAQGDNLIKPLQKLVDEGIFAGKRGPSVPVVIAKLGNTAGILGAAALVIE